MNRTTRWSVGLAAAIVVGAGAIIAAQNLGPDAPVLPAPPKVFPAATGPVVRIAPNGAGTGRSGRWDDAAPLRELPQILATAAPNTQVWLLADRGPYKVTEQLTIAHGGALAAPVVIRGVDKDGEPMAAEIVGTRVEPYDPAGDPGPEVFRLVSGADHLVFQEFAFNDVGNGAFRIAADITDLTIRQSTATNIRRFIEDNASQGSPTASVSGLTVANVTVTGYSRGVARLQYDSNRILFDGVSGDSQRQDGDPFPMGLEFADRVHDVDIRDTSMTNSTSTSGKYWNGDGFSAEEQTYNLRFAHTYSAGNTDAGYDIKSRSAFLTDVIASDNKRNFRFWGNAIVDGCRATDPVLRGGNGTQAQVYATSHAVVTLRGCTISDHDANTIVFDIDGTARVTASDTVVKRSPKARMETVQPGASLQIDGVRSE